MPDIGIADKTTLDAVNTKMGATGDAANASGSIFARLAEMLTNRLTAARAAFLDAAISSRAPSSTALSTATWTAARAANLDNIEIVHTNVPAMADYSNGSAVAGTFYTVLDITGSGILHKAAVNGGTNLIGHRLRITIDGVATVLAPMVESQYSRGIGNAITLQYFCNIKFNTSLKVEADANYSNLRSAVDYSLV